MVQPELFCSVLDIQKIELFKIILTDMIHDILIQNKPDNFILKELNKKVLGHFVVFSYTGLWRKETNMAVASMMTRKIGLIWRHMKPSIGFVLWSVRSWIKTSSI